MAFIVEFSIHIREYEQANEVKLSAKYKKSALLKAWREQLKRDKKTNENYQRVAKEMVGHRNGACKLVPFPS